MSEKGTRLPGRLSRPVGLVLAAACAVTVLAGAPRLAAQESAATDVTQRLFAAVERNDLPETQASIALGADVFARNPRGQTPTELAVDKGHFDIAHYLLSVRNVMRAIAMAPQTPTPSSAGAAAGDIPLAPSAPIDVVQPAMALIMPPLPEAPTGASPEPTAPPLPSVLDSAPTISLADLAIPPAPVETPIPLIITPPSASPNAIPLELAQVPLAPEVVAPPLVPTAPDPTPLAPDTEFLKRITGLLDSDPVPTTEPIIASDAPSPMPSMAEAPVLDSSPAIPDLAALAEPMPSVPDSVAPQPLTERVPEAVPAAQNQPAPSPEKGYLTRLTGLFGAKPSSPPSSSEEKPAPTSAQPGLLDRLAKAVGLSRNPDRNRPTAAPPTQVPAKTDPDDAFLQRITGIIGDDGVAQTADASAASVVSSPADVTVPAPPTSTVADQTMPATEQQGIGTLPANDPGEIYLERLTALLDSGSFTGAPGEAPSAARPDSAPTSTPASRASAPASQSKTLDVTAPIPPSIDEMFAEAPSPTHNNVAPLSDPTKQVADSLPSPPPAPANPPDRPREVSTPTIAARLNLSPDPNAPADPLGFAQPPAAAAASAAAVANKAEVGSTTAPLTPAPTQVAALPGESGNGGWAVKELQVAAVPPALPKQQFRVMTPQDYMKNTVMALGTNIRMGKDPRDPLGMNGQRPGCVAKNGETLFFCIEPVEWPATMQQHFNVSTIMYTGPRAIIRYDNGKATYVYALFHSGSYDLVTRYFEGQYGPATEALQRVIAPLAQPRLANPTVIWRSVDPTTNMITNLEVRRFDDARGGFPDTKFGVVLLHQAWAPPIFPLLSTLELMRIVK